MAMRRATGLLRPYLRGSRRLATTANEAPKAETWQPRRGPMLPPNNDPAAYGPHPQEHGAQLASRWLKITGVGTCIIAMVYLTMGDPHKPHQEAPEYEYLKRAVRSPRFPWGEQDLIGTPEDRGEEGH